jgi:DNA-binding PadR family transcriptional regulator
MPRPAQGNPLNGSLELLLLGGLRDVEAHGYALISRLRVASNGQFDLPEGSVYPALHRLEAAGLVSGRWLSQAGRRRRAYSLTRAGRRALADRSRQWAEFVSGVDSVLGDAR